MKKQLAEVRDEKCGIAGKTPETMTGCAGLWAERVAETVAAVKRQEQAEKEQKRGQSAAA